MNSLSPAPTEGKGADLIRHYAEVRARLRGTVVRVRRAPLPVATARPRSLAEVEPELPIAVDPCPLNMLAAPSWRFLVAYCAVKHGQDRADILSASRAKPVVAARDEAIHLVRHHVPAIGVTRIGVYFGRDHSTIVSTLQRYSERKSHG